MNRTHLPYGLALVLVSSACGDSGENATTMPIGGTPPASSSGSMTGGGQDMTSATQGTMTATAGTTNTTNPTTTTTGPDTSSSSGSDDGDDGQDSQDEGQDDQSGDVTSCDRDEVLCDGECIDPETDEDFCGARNECRGNDAGEKCENGEMCIRGRCEEGCPGGKVMCDRACIDPMFDNEYCGAEEDCEDDNAGEECRSGEVCNMGRCDDECPDGYVLCDDRCIDPRSDGDFCGARDECEDEDEGERCGSDEVCVDGRCEDDCPSGEIVCDERCIDPDTNPNYCGADDDCEDSDAGEVCDDDEVCDDGRCEDECGSGLVACDRNCIDPDEDPRYCGVDDDCRGGETCDFGEECVDGRCEGGAGWSTALEVDDEDDDVSQAKIGSDADGNLVAVWIQDDRVWGSTYDERDERWDSPEQIDSDDDRSIDDLELVVDEDGDAIAAWIQDDRVWTRRLVNGDWQGNSASVQQSSYDASELALGMDRSNGRALVAWVAESTTSTAIGMESNYFDGSRWVGRRTPSQVQQNQELRDPHVSINADGDGLLVWTREGNTGNVRIVGSRFAVSNNTGTWNTAAYLGDQTQEDELSPQVYVDEDGAAVAIWVLDESRPVVHYSTLGSNSNTGWANARELSGADDLASTDHLRLVGGGGDVALAVWLQDDGDSSSAVYASMWSGNDFERAEIVQTDDRADSEEFSAYVNSRDDAVVVWVQDDGGDQRLFSNFRSLNSSNGDWEREAIAVENGDDDAEGPDVCLDDDGRAGAVWLMEDRDGVGLWSATYDPDDDDDR